MLKKLNIIHIVILIIDLLVIPLVGFLQGFDSPHTFIAFMCTLLLGHPLIYLIMMVIKTSKINEYEAPKYMPLCMVLTILLGCLIWYIFFNVEHIFIQNIGLWYGAGLLAFAIPIIIYNILERINARKKNNGPKFIKNK